MASILLVDDDEDLAQTLAEVLEMMEHSVQVIGDGQSAIDAMKTGRFDLVLLDWQLPDMSGLDVCKEYRNMGAKSPVLMLTGMRDAGSKELGRAAGADDFLTKPFTLDQLMERVQQILGIKHA